MSRELKLILGVFILLFFTWNKSMAQNDSIRRTVNKDSIINAYFKISVEKKIEKSDFVQSTERAYDILDEAKTLSTLGWQELNARNVLADNNKILKVLRKVLKRHTNSDFRNLQLYHNMLEDIRNKNEQIRERLKDKKEQILLAQANIRLITNDTIIREMVIRSVLDTTKSGRRSKALRAKYTTTEAFIKTSLDSVNKWNSRVSMQAIMVSGMMQKMDSIMQQSGLQALEGDYPFIWEKERPAVTDTSEANQKSTVASENKKIIHYYVKKNLSTILWLPLIILVMFFLWTRRKYKRFKAADKNLLGDDAYMLFIPRSRLISCLVISLSLFPLFDVHAPWFYLLVNQCVVILSVMFLFWQKEKRNFLPVFVFLLLMLVAITIVNSVEPGHAQRYILMALNIISVVSGIFLLPRTKHLPQIKRTVRVISFIYIGVNFLAIVCNIFGRVIIAEGFTNAGIIGITQIITLSVFLQILSEVFYLQLVCSRIKRNIKLSSDYVEVLTALNKPLFFFSLIIWTMMFFANLYMYEMIEKGVIRILTKSINIGSLSFTVGNVMLFFFIIWIAHLMQKYIGAFFGDSDGEEDLENKKERSRMMVVKLVVLCIGYLLAVAVSGLPVDKITIVIGALGVGVGMGLQNIVNNFVSGVVLIFDRPLQIGDTIEVGGNSGKVKNIGIRSSTLLTDEGAEVIIPNGDILSRPITNWTLSNNQRRIDLEFNLQTTENKETILQLVKDTLKASEGVVAEKDPVILYDQVKEDEANIKIFFWGNNANKADWIKSEVRYILYGKFREKKINVL